MSLPPIIPYNPNTCGCCGPDACPSPVFLYEIKQVTHNLGLAGYGGFSTDFTFFRSAVSRGWSGVHSAATIIRNRVACTIAPVGSASPTYGNCWSRGYSGNPTFPPGDAYVVASSDTCADGFLSFYQFPWSTTLSNTRVQGIPLYDAITAVLVVTGGFEDLLNPVTGADIVADVRKAVADAAWECGGSVGECQGDPTDFLAYSESSEIYLGTDTVGGASPMLYGLTLRTMRYRWKFLPPDTGNYSISWTIMFTPYVLDDVTGGMTEGTPEIYDDTNKWRWDGDIPTSYTPENDLTWPRTPWFEMPEDTANGKYRITNVVRACDAPATPTAPAVVIGV